MQAKGPCILTYLRTWLANVRHVFLLIFTYVPILKYENIRCTLHGTLNPVVAIYSTRRLLVGCYRSLNPRPASKYEGAISRPCSVLYSGEWLTTGVNDDLPWMYRFNPSRSVFSVSFRWSYDGIFWQDSSRCVGSFVALKMERTWLILLET